MHTCDACKGTLTCNCNTYYWPVTVQIGEGDALVKGQFCADCASKILRRLLSLMSVTTGKRLLLEWKSNDLVA